MFRANSRFREVVCIEPDGLGWRKGNPSKPHQNAVICCPSATNDALAGIGCCFFAILQRLYVGSARVQMGDVPCGSLPVNRALRRFYLFGKLVKTLGLACVLHVGP